MACNGTYCVNCTSNYCQGKHRAYCGSNSYSFPAIGDRPTANYTNHLKIALNNEINVRNSKRGYGVGAVSFTDATTSNYIAKTNVETLTQLKSQLNAVINNWHYYTGISKAVNQTTAGSYPTGGGDGLSTPVLEDSYTPGTKITAAHWTNIQNKILTLMKECLCNGDCGSNYWCGCHNNCDCNYSDSKLKENIKDENFSLDDFNKIKSKSWNYVFDKEHRFVGPIAQEVEEVFPEAIREDDNGYKMLNQTSMIGILWSALNKSIDKINELETRLDSLEQK